MSFPCHQTYSMTLLKDESVSIVGPCRPPSGGEMVPATTCVTPVGFTTKWTASTDLLSNLKDGWWVPYQWWPLLLEKMFSFIHTNVYGMFYCYSLPQEGWACPAPTVTPPPPPCGGEMQRGSRCATPVAFTWNCMGWDTTNTAEEQEYNLFKLIKTAFPWILIVQLHTEKHKSVIVQKIAPCVSSNAYQPHINTEMKKISTYPSKLETVWRWAILISKTNHWF